jgi:hypothetical protein
MKVISFLDIALNIRQHVSTLFGPYPGSIQIKLESKSSCEEDFVHVTLTKQDSTKKKGSKAHLQFMQVHAGKGPDFTSHGWVLVTSMMH